MTSLQLSKAIGQTVMLEARGLSFLCSIKDARESFGRPQFLVAPLMGSGEIWVDIGSVTPVQATFNQEHLDKPGRVATPKYALAGGVYKSGHYQGHQTPLGAALSIPPQVGTITRSK